MDEAVNRQAFFALILLVTIGAAFYCAGYTGVLVFIRKLGLHSALLADKIILTNFAAFDHAVDTLGHFSIGNVPGAFL